MRERTSLTASGARAASRVTGHTPPLAKVAPITANVSQCTSMEQVCRTQVQFVEFCILNSLWGLLYSCINWNKCSTNTQSRLPVALDGCTRTSPPTAALLCPISLVQEATFKVRFRALKGYSSSVNSYPPPPPKYLIAFGLHPQGCRLCTLCKFSISILLIANSLGSKSPGNLGGRFLSGSTCSPSCSRPAHSFCQRCPSQIKIWSCWTCKYNKVKSSNSFCTFRVKSLYNGRH